MSEFRDRVNAAVPPPPDTDGWAARAERTGRSRRLARWLSVGVGAVVLVLVVAFLPGWFGRYGDAEPPVLTAYPVPMGPSTGATGTDGCPTVPEAYASPNQAVTLPAGATSLRWCTNPQETGMLAVYAPPEPLTVNVGAWVSAFNALKPVAANQACTADYSSPALALLTYGDGTVRTVAGMAAGCGVIGGRLGFTTMQQLTVDLLRGARGESWVPPSVPFTVCGASRSLIPAEIGRVSQAALCERFGASPTARMIPQAALNGLRADLEAHLVPVAQPDPADGPELQLYQQNGERLSLQYSTGAARWQLTRWSTDRTQPPQYFTWTPSPTTQTALQQAQQGPTLGPPPSATASPGPSSGGAPETPCRTAIAQLAEKPTLGATQVWFCSDWRYAPPDPLTTRLDQFVLGFERETYECAPRPQDEAFVVAYPDGRLVRIPLPAGKCAQRTNAVRTFQQLLEKQRGPGFQGEPVTVPKLCELKQANYLADNVMPMTPRDATVVRFCGYDRAGGLTGDQIDGLPLRPGEVTTVIDDLIARSVKLGGVVDAPKRPVVIVLQRLNGERIWVEADAAGTYYWSAPGEATLYSWQPSAAVKAILDGYR